MIIHSLTLFFGYHNNLKDYYEPKKGKTLLCNLIIFIPQEFFYFFVRKFEQNINLNVIDYSTELLGLTQQIKKKLCILVVVALLLPKTMNSRISSKAKS